MSLAASDRWHEIDTLFERTLDLDPAERAAFLDTACDDAELRAAVERLLEASEAAVDHFAEGVAYFAPAFDDEAELPASLAGTEIGPWRIVREIGRGGMSTVYLAERADGLFAHRVAVKVLRRGLDTGALAVRFRVERRILGALDHPNIARILDGGVTPGGQPYLVMGYVEGEPIAAYCERRGLGVEARLHLFLQVCDAVAYAHRRLVVHRDLKPSNVLVSEDDQGVPLVKLLDFGIAKLVEEDGEETAPLTQTGERWLTPEYAAPEQIRGEAVTTTVDVWALGVLLYEMLAGARPFHREGGGRYTLERAILEEEPPRLSYLANERKAFRGDLDTIGLKALRKEPEHRYASVEALADDIRAHLTGLPVAARPATVRYRMGAFVRRHRASVAAAALVLAALVFGLGAALWQAQRAEAQAERAALEAEKADRVTEFVVGLLQAEDPREAQGDTVTVRDVLERGLPRIAELEDQPEVQAQLYLTTSEVYQSLGDFDRADSLAMRSLALREALYGPRSAEVAAVQTELTRLYVKQARLEEAEDLIRSAVATLQEVRGDHDDTATALDFLGQVLQNQQNYEAAEATLVAAVAMQRRLKPGVHEGLATSLSNLGMLYHYQDQFVKAEALYREALAAQREILGEKHPYVNIMRHNSAHLYLSLERYDEAEALFREVVQTDREVFGADHPSMAAGFAGLAMVLSQQGEFEEADTLYLAALRIAREQFGEGHRVTLHRLRQYGIHVEEQGLYEAAAQIIDEVIETTRRVRQVNEDVAMRVRARLHRKQGEAEQSLALLQRTQSAYRERHEDASHPAHAIVLGNIALTLQALGRYDEAEAAMTESLAMTEASVGSDHPDVAWALNKLGNIRRDRGAYATAEEAYDRAEAMLGRLAASNGPSAALLTLDRSRLALARGDAAAAERHAQQGLTRISDVRRDAHPSVAEAHGVLGRALLAQGRYAEAEAQLLTHQRSLAVSTSPERTETEALLDTLYQRWGRPERAAAYRSE